MSKYSKLIKEMGFRILNDVELGHSDIILQKDGGDCWLYYGTFETRKEAYLYLIYNNIH